MPIILYSKYIFILHALLAGVWLLASVALSAWLAQQICAIVFVCFVSALKIIYSSMSLVFCVSVYVVFVKWVRAFSSLNCIQFRVGRG